MSKKPFLYGFRGKAVWKVNRVFMAAFAVVAVYLYLGRLSVCIAIASQIPDVPKWVLGAALLACVWYCDRRIAQRVRDPALPGIPSAWFTLLGILALLFAVATADSRTFFRIYNCGLTLFLCGSSWRLRRNLDRARRSRQRTDGRSWYTTMRSLRRHGLRLDRGRPTGERGRRVGLGQGHLHLHRPAPNRDESPAAQPAGIGSRAMLTIHTGGWTTSPPRRALSNMPPTSVSTWSSR